MPSYRLVINNKEIKTFDPSEFTVLATFQSKLVTELNKFVVFYTKTSTLPVSRDLNEALSHPTQLDSDYKPTSKPTIDFYVDNEPVLRGYMNILSGSIQSVGGSVSFRIEPRDRDWWDQFKTFTMQDVDLSAEDHVITSNDVEQSNTDQASWPYNVQYPSVDVGWVGYRSIVGMTQTVSGSTVTTYVYYTGEDIGTSVTETVTIVGCENDLFNIECDLEGFASTYWNGAGVYEAHTTDLPLIDDAHKQSGFFRYNSEEVWRVHDYCPATPLSLLFDAAFAEAGYTIENDWVSSNLADTYHYEYNKAVWAKGFDSSLRFSVGIKEGGYTLTGVAGATRVPFSRYTGVGLLNNSNYDTTDSETLSAVVAGTHHSYFVAPYDCFMAFKTRLVFYGDATEVSVLLRDGAGTFYTTPARRTISGDGHDQILSGVAFIPAGYSMEVRITFDPSTYTPVLSDECYFEAFQVRKVIEGMQVNVADFQTDKTAYQWVKDMALIYNLQFFTDPILKRVTIVPDEQKLLEDTQDWTNKLDRQTEVTITEISKQHPQTYRMDYLQDSNDFELQRREEISGRFAGGDLTNNDPFADGTNNTALEVYAATINGGFDYYDFRALGVPLMKGENDERLEYVSRLLEIDYEDTNPDQLIEGVSTTLNWYFEGSSSDYMNRANFPDTLHFDSLIENYYARFQRLINYGYIIQAAFDVTVKDAARITRIEGERNAFRSNYAIKLDGVEVKAELYSVKDYSPVSDKHTICELIWLKIS